MHFTPYLALIDPDGVMRLVRRLPYPTVDCGERR